VKKEQAKKGAKSKNSLKKATKPEIQLEKKKYTGLVGLGIILLLGIIIYSDSFNCSFHFDDYASIVNNKLIRNLADVKAWWNFSPNRLVPVFSFALNYHFNQLDICYWHLVNLLIHLINACLVWWLTLLILSTPGLKDEPISQQKKIIAFFTALLFVSSPLATQSVTYIVQRQASMAAMFYLSALAFFVKARLSIKGNKSKTFLYTGALISAVLAMLSKENAFTLPLAILLTELFFLRTKRLSINFKDYRLIISIAVFTGIMLIIPLKYSFRIFDTIHPAGANVYTITPVNYLFTQFSVIVKYIQLLILPINQNFDYDFPVTNNFFEIRTLLSFLVLLSLFILAIFFYKRYRILSFGIFWFFLTLSVESSFIPIDDVIFEHRTYLPSFGIFLIISSGIYLLLWKKYKYSAILLLLIITGSNSYLTYTRNKVWKDDLTLWSDVISKSPDKARPFAIRGYSYATLGNWDMAISDYSRAIEINPKYYTEAYTDRGVSYGNLNQWDKAITDYSTAIGIDAKSTDAFTNRGVAYCNLGQWEKAIADFNRAIKINPKCKEAYTNRGIANCNLGKWDNAIEDFSKAIGNDPEDVNAFYNRGNTYGNLGQWEKAITDFSRVIEINPNFTQAYTNRDIVYRKLQSEKR
jgi:tetratricopeptide (TPR) repeat protein